MSVPHREGEEGMMLIGVLLIVALAAGVLAIMLTMQDVSLERSQRLHEAAQADAYIEGGTLSAVTALRRDGLRAPETDNIAEPWAQIGERGIAIPDGTFALVIADAQDRLNINQLARDDTPSINLMQRIVAALGLKPEVATKARALVATLGPLPAVDTLRLAGFSDRDVAALATMVTALPQPTTINLNSAREPLLAVLLDNPVTAHRLVDRRARAGYLEPDALIAEHSLLPPGAGYTSSYYWVRTRVTIGDTSRQATVLLVREIRKEGVRVRPIATWRGSSVPIDAPRLTEARADNALVGR